MCAKDRVHHINNLSLLLNGTYQSYFECVLRENEGSPVY